MPATGVVAERLSLRLCCVESRSHRNMLRFVAQGRGICPAKLAIIMTATAGKPKRTLHQSGVISLRTRGMGDRFDTVARQLRER